MIDDLATTPDKAERRASAPAEPTVFRRGQVAEAEPAVPGWRLPVNDLFD